MSGRRASLFATCLVDQFKPEVAFAVVKVLRRLGVEVDVPKGQACCGQPAFNSGFHEEARSVARGALDAFEDSEAVVVPSGSCASMVRHHYASLFEGDPVQKARAQRLAEKTWEFSEYLVRKLGIEDVGASFQGSVTYHPSRHLLRDLKVAEEPPRLIRAVKGAEVRPLERSEECCGFGGTFSAKFPALAGEMGRDKVRALKATGADLAVACDSGCLMQMQSLLGQDEKPRPCHLAELLAR